MIDMTELPLPERLEELIAGYVTTSLTPEETQEFEQLLAEDPSIAVEVERFQEAYTQLAYTSPLVAPPSPLRSSILHDASISTSLPQRVIARKPSIKWNLITAGIPILCTLYLGFDGYRLRQDLNILQTQSAYQKDTIAMLQQSSTNLVSLKGMDRAANASGNVVITPGEPQAVLVLRNLPDLPQGQGYYVWAVKNGKKTPLGQFNPNSQGNVLTKLPLPLNSQIQSLVITIENSSSPTQSTGPMVMTSDV